MRAYLQLLRLPTVFTAMADIVLGFVLTHRFLYGPLPASGPAELPQIGWNHLEAFLGLLVASSCLYLAGMVFNDVFDVRQDTAERPGRPIPSGRVSRRSAVSLGVILIVAGNIAAALVSQISAQVALILVVMILAYDGILKRTPLGPLAMGSCRFLNVMLGASFQNNWLPDFLALPQLAVALGLGIYITGVTVFARTEAHVSNRSQLGLAQLLMNCGFAILGWIIISTNIPSPIAVPLAMLTVVAFTINRRAIEAIRDPQPAVVQAGIRVMLLSLVMLDSTVIFWYLNTPDGAIYGTAHALATALLVVPAMFLGRWIAMT